MGQEFKVGLFTLVTLGVLGFIFFVLSPDSFTRRGTVSYFTMLDDASGVIPKTHVKTNGVIVGKVSNVSLRENRTRVDLEIEEGLKIPVGSEIYIREKGLLGDVFVDISRAAESGAYISPGEMISPAKDQFNLSKIIDIAGRIGRDVKVLTSALTDDSGEGGGISQIKQVFNEIHGITKSLNAMLEENRADIRGTAQNVHEITKTLNTVLSSREQTLSKTIDDISQVSRSLVELFGTENRDKINGILTTLNNSMTDVSETAKDLRSIAQKIDKGQGTLGKLVNDDKAIQDIEIALKDVRELISPANKTHVFVDYHNEFKGDQRTQHFFEVRLQPRPDKYYLVGLTDVNESIRETYTETAPVKDRDISEDTTKGTKTREKTYEKNALRFNLQYARRWGALQFRLGLFQSSGGIASDIFLFADKLRFSLEAFDWRPSESRRYARLKSYLSILFFDHVYLMAGADDLTSKHPLTGKRQSPQYFAGGGVFFSDDDLKSMIGLAAKGL